jgi:hypothetical protein
VISLAVPAAFGLGLFHPEITPPPNFHHSRDTTVAGALEALLPQITWYTREGLTSRHSDFAERHALATLVGPAERPGVLEVRDDVIVGISLLAPLTEYPDHRHPPEELYLALTPGEWRQDLGAWFEPGPGGIVYNTSNILHGMRAGASPQLALWCLPT